MVVLFAFSCIRVNSWLRRKVEHMNLYRGLNSYAEAAAILTHMTAGGFAPVANETPSKPPENRCLSQKGTEGETVYPQESAWKYFMQDNHSGDDALVEYTEEHDIAVQFSRPIFIGVEVADAWCFALKDHQEKGVMMYRRTPLIQIYGMSIGKTDLHSNASQQDLGYYNQVMQLVKTKNVKFF
jgi:hypothetical protein